MGSSLVMLSFVSDDHVTGYTAKFDGKTSNTIILFIANWNNLNVFHQIGFRGWKVL